jgi:uncharacterized protein YndB with AHSA1/START domain
MPVKKDPDGRRSVEAEVIVPGTPEEVWRAIATGPGISAWFVPSTVEERAGGAAVANFGPGMVSEGKITEWEPPRRYVVETSELGPNDPAVASEWIVEARGGGTCAVRIVHRWFSSSDDWDNQFEGHEQGWQSFFRILRLYLANFSGQPSASFQIMGMAPEPKETAWAALTEKLGIAGAQVGKRVQTAASAPRMAGFVERVGEAAYPEELLLRLDEPAPGIAHLFAMPMGGQIFLSMRLYLFGKRPADAASQSEQEWQAWIGQHFPAGAGVNC